MSLLTANHDAPNAVGADAGIDLFAPIAVRAQFAAGEEVYAQEAETAFIYYVETGSVRTTRLLSDGRRQIGDFYYRGALFGIEPGPTHRFAAEALEDCEVLIVRRTALSQHGEQGVRLERLIWGATAKELERTQEHLMLLGRKTAAERVATFLLDIADRSSGDLMALPMGRQDMADYLGLTIETVSRMLTQLQAQDLVEFASCRRFRIKHRVGLVRLVGT